MPRVRWKAHSQREAADIVGVPPTQIAAAIKRGDLGHVRIGRHIRIADSELRRFVGQAPATADEPHSEERDLIAPRSPDRADEP